KSVRFALLASEEARSKLVLDKAELHAQTALSLASGDLERSLALEALGSAYLHDFQGDLAWQSLKEAVDLRLAVPAVDGKALAQLCASALEVATRTRGAMRSRRSHVEAWPYLDLGLGQAGKDDSEALARLLIVQSFWPYSFRDLDVTEEAKREALEAGERAEAMARRMGRLDL